MQLTHNPDSVMILREDIDDPSTETRIALPAGAQLVVDSERMWHSVWHQGDEPRYCLITSVESGPALEKWIFENSPRTKVDSAFLDQGARVPRRDRGAGAPRRPHRVLRLRPHAR